MVVSAAKAEEVLIVELGVYVFGDLPVNVVAVVSEAESRGGMGVRDICDGCERERASKEVAADHCVGVGANEGVVFSDVLE